MKNVDYIVVGSGLAGIMFCDVLQQHNKSYVVFDDGSQQSSIVAGGLYNPVVLKRFTPVWKSKEQLELGLPRYHELESQLGVQLDYKIPIYRLFASVEEQNNWFLACDKPGLTNYLRPEILQVDNSSIKSSYGFGEVVDTGRIDTTTLINSFKTALKVTDSLIESSFNHDNLEFHSEGVQYGDISAKYVVFAEGYGVKKNLYFNQLPLKGTKGELLVIHAPKLKIEFVLKSGAFLIPLGDDNYIVGATYEWADKTNTTTIEARKELVEKLNHFINCEYKIIDQIAGMRPTVIDRRPLVGQHSKHKQLYILNGLGTRGVMIAPYVAQQLYNFIENKVNLDTEINIERFTD